MRIAGANVAALGVVSIRDNADTTGTI